jgi:hypothetical protein
LATALDAHRYYCWARFGISIRPVYANLLQSDNGKEFRWIRSEVEAGNWEAEGTWFSRLRRVILECLLPVLNLQAIESGHTKRSVLSDDYLDRHLYAAFTSGKQSPEGGPDSFPEQFPIFDEPEVGFWKALFDEQRSMFDELEVISLDTASDSGFRLTEPYVTPEDIKEAVELSATVRDQFIDTIEREVHPVPSSLQCC